MVSAPDLEELQSQVTDLLETLQETHRQLEDVDRLDSYMVSRVLENVEDTLRRYDAL